MKYFLDKMMNYFWDENAEIILGTKCCNLRPDYVDGVERCCSNLSLLWLQPDLEVLGFVVCHVFIQCLTR